MTFHTMIGCPRVRIRTVTAVILCPQQLTAIEPRVVLCILCDFRVSERGATESSVAPISTYVDLSSNVNILIFALV
jgi:hypothetical protein